MAPMGASKKTKTLTSELEAQYSVIEKIWAELKTAKAETEKVAKEKKGLEAASVPRSSHSKKKRKS